MYQVLGQRDIWGEIEQVLEEYEDVNEANLRAEEMFLNGFLYTCVLDEEGGIYAEFERD